MSLRCMKKSPFVKKIEEFSKKLSTDFVKKLFVFDDVVSTNTIAKELALTGAKEGTVVIAKTQTHGRGRLDRIWQSPEGGVYISVILRPTSPAEKTSLLPFVAALAVTTTIESYRVHATIKWPNDVRVNEKKIAGILLESELKGPIVNYVVIGIGINLNVDLILLSSDLQSRSTSMISELNRRIDPNEFLNRFFHQFYSFYTLFKENQYENIVNQWRLKTDTIGRYIQIQTPLVTVQGTALDVDQSGFLLLKSDTGEIKKIMSGDCLHLDELHHT
jgi:BirA family transcriptional regulator, biotin operon repressor / biotin---[acetyl-CoA-carboxylase] ligase